MRQDAQAVRRGEMTVPEYGAKHDAGKWWLVFADEEGSSSRSMFLYFNTNFRTDFGSAWFGAYRNVNGGVEYGGRYHGTSVSDYQKLAGSIGKHSVPTDLPWSATIDRSGKNLDSGENAETNMWGNRIVTTINSNAIDGSKGYLTIEHEIFHVRDYANGLYNRVYNDRQFTNNRPGIARAVLEVRAYTHSNEIAKANGWTELFNNGLSQLNNYKSMIPSNYEKYIKSY